MKRQILTLLALCAAAFSLPAQTDWAQVERLISDGSYKTAYSKAETVYGNPNAAGRQRLVAAYYMAQAAAYFQEEARDSAEMRYRALLPVLEDVDKALCHTFLAEWDSAMLYEEPLKRTPVEKIKPFAEGDKGLNVTPTAYDLMVMKMQDRGELKPAERVEWQRKLCSFHAGDNKDIRLWHDLRLLDFMDLVPNVRLKDDTVLAYISRYRNAGSQYITKLYAMMALRCSGRGDLVQSVAWCDSAIALYPKSEGGVECANLKNEIQQKCVSMETSSLWVIPGQPSLQRVRYCNVERLYYRIVNYFDDYRWNDKAKGKLLAAKTVVGGEWKVESGKEYKFAESYVSLPALKTGRWLLLVSPSKDFKTDGFMVYVVNSTEMLLVQNEQEGLLLDRRTGRPIAGQAMCVERRDNNGKVTVMARAVTDRYGRYSMDYEKPRWGDQIAVERNGYRLTSRYSNSSNRPDTSMHMCAEVRTDRPIYKPGDTIQVAVVVYRTDGLEAEVAIGERLKLAFVDPHDQGVDTVSLTTDDFGIAHTSFVVPTDRIAGTYFIRSVDGGKVNIWENVHVEEYKQPKFMVQLGEQGVQESPSFGVPYTVKGFAASYNAVPVSGAKVHYRVMRRQLHRCWWFYSNFYSESEVAAGETTTAADGSFSVTFIPEPDSSVELSHKPSFEYVVSVDVTDLNGESHNAVSSLRVGFTNAFVYLESGSTPATLKVKHVDINGNPLPGEVKTKVELLCQPPEPLLDHPLLHEGVHHTMTEAEWHKAFPLLAYGIEYNDPANWPVASNGWKGESGVYRVTISADGADTVTEYLTYVASDARKVPSQKLLWAEVEKTKVEVGETARLRFGSRFKEVEVYYMLRVGNEVRDFSLVRLSDEIRSIEIPVDSTMLGGFQIDLVSVREGVECHWQQRVYVPFSHKQLKVDIATFRDKLLPGEQEEWTVSVKSYESGVKSALMMTMYDDALNSYGSAWQWGFSPWRTNYSRVINPLHITGGVGHWMNEYKHLYYHGSQLSVWSLKDALPYFSPWRGRRMYKSAGVSNQAMVELAVVEDVELLDEAKAAGGTAPVDDEPQVRMNLNTLAFFAPTLRTDENGTVTYRFTVPELLTRWNVRALAVSKDLKIGTLDKTLITQKPLMVQPNMPRFLRSGDSLALMAKIVASEQWQVAREVEVSLLLTDAATGDTICHHTEEVKVKDAAQVTFPVEVPQGVYVVTYRIIAAADGMSDGEQGQVPVLSNRETVTVSQALCINGVGEKSFTFPQDAFASSTAAPQQITAEVTGSPIWLALKALPHMKDLENPSTLYLAEQVGVNSLVLEVAEKVDVSSIVPVDSIEERNRKLKAQLMERRNGDGGWSWMPDGQSSVWVTQQVLKRFADSKALAYVDKEVQRDYERYVKPYAKKYKWQPTNIDYLYMRSLYGKASTEAYRFYYANALKHYKDYEGLYTQAQLALIFHRHGDRKAANDLLRRLKEKALTSDEMGMYWRDNRSGWCWYQRPIETQALLIQAFTEVASQDSLTVGLMQQWLLKQKQTTHWGNDRATAEAIRALVSMHPHVGPSTVGLTLFGTPMTAEVQGQESYRTQVWTGAELDTLVRQHSEPINMVKNTPGIAWGAVYYQFEDNIDKLPSSDMGITVKCTYIATEPMKVGDKVKVRIDIRCDRAIDYLELVDGRPSCVEPVSTSACWRWNDGLSYYYTVNNNDTRCYIEHVEKGKYSIEYEVYVTNPGAFMSGALKMQCMYAPEFRAVEPGKTLFVMP